MAKQKPINIRPGVGILGIFPAMNYRAWYALGELVDNAIDSYLTHQDRLRSTEGEGFILRIVIEVSPEDGGFIRVWDNAAGIATKDYARAFVTAEPPTDSAGLSQFGIGMKSASCWFARQWDVASSALGEKVERQVSFNVPEIIAKGVESIDPEVVPAKPRDHFTEVRLWDLYKPPQTRTIGKMRSHIASMYRIFLRRGDIEIVFNGESIRYEEPAVLVAPRAESEDAEPILWSKQIDIKMPTGERVHGFAALRETGSTQLAGFALFRFGRLIVGSDEDTYRPSTIFGGSNSFRYQRLFGELTLDEFDVSHTKDSFIWGESEEELLQALKIALDEEPIPLLNQAEAFRARKASHDLLRAAEQAVDSTAAALESVADVISGQVSKGPDLEPVPEAFNAKQVSGQRTLSIVVKNKLWLVTVELSSDEANRDWVTIADDKPSTKSGEPRRLTIRLSVVHPFTQRYGGATSENVESLVRFGAALAIAEITSKEAGVARAATVRRNINELLRALAKGGA